MNPNQTPTPEESSPQPAGYDQFGRPLYAHPPTTPVAGSTVIATEPSTVTQEPDHYQGENFDPRTRKQYSMEPDFVHVTRDIEPVEREISPELLQMHEVSRATYPQLNLSPGEHVIVAVRRHIIGLFLPVGVAALLIVILLAGLLSYPLIIENIGAVGLPSLDVIAIPVLALAVLVALGGYIAVWVYRQNKFFMTNESVIQEIQYSLFARNEQTVSLGSVEDASFTQTGIIQMLFNYGSIRLSTEGEETTYRFHFVADPKRQIAILNNAIESFKNGRPVTGEIV